MNLVAKYNKWCGGSAVETKSSFLDKQWAVGQLIFFLLFGCSLFALQKLDIEKSWQLLLYFLCLSLLIMTPVFISMHKSGTLVIERSYNASALEATVGAISVSVLMGTFALISFSFLLSFIPVPFTAIGDSWRYKSVRSFSAKMEEHGFSTTLLFDEDVLTKNDKLMEAKRSIDRIYHGNTYERAMLNLRLLEMDEDPRYILATKQGWISKLSIEEIGKELIDNPPVEMESGSLKHQAFIRIIGDRRLDEPFTD